MGECKKPNPLRVRGLVRQGYSHGRPGPAAALTEPAELQQLQHLEKNTLLGRNDSDELWYWNTSTLNGNPLRSGHLLIEEC